MSLRKLLASLLVVSMVLGLVGGSALAAEAGQAAPPELLVRFGIVKGDPSGDYRLNDPITRAEMVTVLVRARGDEDKAALLQGAQPFSDVAGNAWYSGYIAYAKNAGIANGYPDGTFKPDAKVTYAEAVAFLVKFLGLQPVAGAEWPNNYIQAFENAGLAIEDLNLTEQANAPAVRGRVFELADNAFRYGGAESAYAKLDGQPPVLTVDPVAPTTEATKVTITGKVEGAVKVLVNDTEVTVAEDGSFSAEVELAVGANTIIVKAVDDVGLVTEKTIEVTRNLTPAAKIEAQDIEVEAGQTVDVNVKVLDQNGAEIPDAVAQITGESDLGKFEAGKFIAGEKAGTGTLTLKYGELTATVNVVVKPGPLAKLEVNPSTLYAAPGERVTFTVKGLDAFGNEVGPVAPTFSVEPVGGALIDPATGDFIASKPGVYTVTATYGDIPGKAVVGVYGEVAGLKIEGPTELVANNATEAEFTVYLVDEFGNVVVKDEEDAIELDFDDVIEVDGGKVLDVKGGKATFKVKSAEGVLGGLVVEITAKYAKDEDIPEVTHELELTEQVATSLVFKEDRSDKYLVANESKNEATLVFWILDQVGEKMLSGSWDITFELSDEDLAKIADADSAVIDGEAKIVLESIEGETGTVTVTATVEGLAPATGTVRAVIAGEPVKVVAEVTDDEAVDNNDEVNEVKFTVVDKNGVPVTGQYDLEVDLGSDKIGVVDDEGNLVDPVRDNVYKFTITKATHTIKVRTKADGPAAGTYEIKGRIVSAQVGNLDLDDLKKLKESEATAKITFVAGDAHHAVFDVDTDVPILVSPTQNKAEVTLKVVDLKGNPVKKADFAAKVRVVEEGDAEPTDRVLVNGTKGKEVEVKTNADGVATITLEVLPYFNFTYTLQVTNNPTDTPTDAKDEVDITLVDTLPTSLSIVLKVPGGSPNNLKAGNDFLVEVYPKDAYGRLVEGLEGYLKWDVEDDVFGTLDENGNIVRKAAGDLPALEEGDDVYSQYLYAVAAGRQTVRVKLVNIAGKTLTASRSILVKADDPVAVEIADAADYNEAVLYQGQQVKASGKLEVRVGEVKAVKASLVDRFGNDVSVSASQDVTVEVYKVTGNQQTVVADVEVRTSEGGLKVSSFKLKSTTTLYLAATERDEDADYYVLRLQLNGENRFYLLDVQDDE
ncbi:MAG: S-layer homology domain-containing protein [Firmicutes bacterium]|nr:S-layer homology domain-containing protein [Bacillota bacterium]